eukprot:TRINITY_DN54493_c0_g1_i1.p1 TRINITY_DN54493_c0_g1~~TRINITY_DN54493_c0_g1_i1.p1  ORF type:complete len:462 (-),score=56.24 TRINITY_DN54493_c0_g1_i1:136-1521(-)
MGNQNSSRGFMCCAVRDKHDALDISSRSSVDLRFDEKTIEMERPRFACFSPLNQRESAVTRRLAVANADTVHVYHLGLPSEQLPALEYRLCLGADRRVQRICFAEITNARTLIVAFGPTDEAQTSQQRHVIRVWQLDAAAVRSATDDAASVVNWECDAGYAHSIDEHRRPIEHMAVNKTLLATVDGSGACRLFTKSRAFVKAGEAKLHDGSVADFSMDRVFIFSAGLHDRRVRVWSLPQFGLVHDFVVQIPLKQLQNLSPLCAGGTFLDSTGAASAKVSLPPAHAVVSRPEEDTSEVKNSLECITHIRRPVSRWAGWVGSARRAGRPHGVLFVAGVLDSTDLFGGCGVLMEYTLGDQPTCKSSRVAHATPIVMLSYGPYDNGPVITACAQGFFKVWDCSSLRGLHFSYQIDTFGSSCPNICDAFAVATEQPHAVYVMPGSRRLCVWSRADGHSNPGASFAS